MTPPGPDPTEPPADSLRDERIGELINDFFDRKERGEAVDPEDFLARHPEYAAELREHLGGLNLLAKLGSSDGQVTHLAKGGIGGGSSAIDAFEASEPTLPEVPGYEVLKQIGRGGMGIVFKAIQLSTKRVVALKLLLEGPFASDSARRRFEREISLAAQLRHPNIIPIYDSGQAEGRMFYAMEYVFGMSLTDFVKAHGLDLKTRLRLFAGVCAAVGYAHQRGIIHRDLKPSNILVDGTGEPHILDFGLARAGWLGDGGMSMTAQIVGTPAYMSPEQASGDPIGIDTRADVYALGVILYELLTEKMPYDTNVAMGKILHNIAHADPVPPGKINEEVDAEVSAIILKTLEKRKEDRYQSVDALSGDVGRYLAGEPITVQPTGSLYLLRKAAWKHRLAVGAIGVVGFFVLSMIGVVGYFSAKIERKSQDDQRQIEDLRTLKEQVSKKEQEFAELRQAQEEARQAKAELEFFRKNVPQAKEIEKAARAVIPGLGTPDEFAAIIKEGLIRFGQEPPSIKENTVDLSAAESSPKPADLKKPEPKIDPQLVAQLYTLLQNQQAQNPQAATSQPTSQPASSKPAELPDLKVPRPPESPLAPAPQVPIRSP